jgi:hypothetical protein
MVYSNAQKGNPFWAWGCFHDWLGEDTPQALIPPCACHPLEAPGPWLPLSCEHYRVMLGTCHCSQPLPLECLHQARCGVGGRVTGAVPQLPPGVGTPGVQLPTGRQGGAVLVAGCYRYNTQLLEGGNPVRQAGIVVVSARMQEPPCP